MLCARLPVHGIRNSFFFPLPARPVSLFGLVFVIGVTDGLPAPDLSWSKIKKTELDRKGRSVAQTEREHHPVDGHEAGRGRRTGVAGQAPLRRLLEDLGRRRGVQPMRIAGAPNRRTVKRRATPFRTPPPVAVIALNRMGFGPRPGDLELFESLGNTDSSRLEAHVEEQLHPESLGNPELEARLTAAGFTTLSKTPAQLWADHVASKPDWRTRIQPLYETERATFLRALFSRCQLQEVLADFWHNHFNVYAWDYYSGPTWVAWDRDVIRAHVLGNFREMLHSVAVSPAMLVYLDNYINSNAGPNENFARELLELHTMGAEHYMGVKLQSEVPKDSGGLPVAYVDGDVYELTRCFTGWTFDRDSGEFLYREDWHDRFQKHVLGLFLPADQPPLADGRAVLDLVASHPGTARHVARKLCRRLIADEPPETVVEAAATAFLEQQEAPDQLRHVVRTILLSEEFRTTWGAKVKRPFEIVVGAMRATGIAPSFSLDDQVTDRLLHYFDRTGQPLFSHRTPDGYPDEAEDWLSTGTLVATWRTVNWILATDGADELPLFDVASATPVDARSPGRFASYWIRRVLGRPADPVTEQEIVDFLALGRDPEIPLDLGDEDVAERARNAVALIAMSPQFMER